MTTTTTMPDQRSLQQLQHDVLLKYRRRKDIPHIPDIANATNVSWNTVALFMSGHSTRSELRNYIRPLIAGHADKDPALAALLAAWAKEEAA